MKTIALQERTFELLEDLKEKKKAHSFNEEIITPFIVLLELSYRADKEGWDFKRYYNFIKLKSRISGIGEEFILGFGNFYNKIKGKSPNIGIADVIILMTAVKEQAKIVTGDEHFKSMQEVIYLG